MEIINIIPNPVNEHAKIIYYLDKPGNVSLSLQSILGEDIRYFNPDIQYFKNIGCLSTYKNAGEHSIEFDVSNLPSGIYFWTLKAGNQVVTAKMMVIK